MKVGVVNGINSVNSLKNNKARSFKGAPLINGAGGIITEGTKWVAGSTIEPTLKGTIAAAFKGGLLANIGMAFGVLGALALGGFLAKSYDDILNKDDDNDTSISEWYLMQESMFG